MKFKGNGFEGRVALVTGAGAADGIGFAAANLAMPALKVPAAASRPA